MIDLLVPLLRLLRTNPCAFVNVLRALPRDTRAGRRSLLLARCRLNSFLCRIRLLRPCGLSSQEGEQDQSPEPLHAASPLRVHSLSNSPDLARITGPFLGIYL